MPSFSVTCSLMRRSSSASLGAAAATACWAVGEALRIASPVQVTGSPVPRWGNLPGLLVALRQPAVAGAKRLDRLDEQLTAIVVDEHALQDAVGPVVLVGVERPGQATQQGEGDPALRRELGDGLPVGACGDLSGRLAGEPLRVDHPGREPGAFVVGDRQVGQQVVERRLDGLAGLRVGVLLEDRRGKHRGQRRTG